MHISSNLSYALLLNWILYSHVNKGNKIWKREESEEIQRKKNFCWLNKVSLKIDKIQLILIFDKCICNNDNFFFLFIVTIGEPQNWKEDQTRSTAVDRQNVWNEKKATMRLESA